MSKEYIGRKKNRRGIVWLAVFCTVTFALTFLISYSFQSNKKNEKNFSASKNYEKDITEQLDDMFEDKEEQEEQKEIKKADKKENTANEQQKKENENIPEVPASQLAEEANAELYEEGVEANASASKATVPIENGSIEKEFGKRPEYSEFYGDWRMHCGVDIAGTPGDDVRAVSDGTVIESYIDPINGGTMKIEHKGFVSVYMGLRPEDMEMNGTVVKQGDVIGTLEGQILGENAGVHLHFEIHEDGNPVDPMKYIG